MIRTPEIQYNKMEQNIVDEVSTSMSQKTCPNTNIFRALGKQYMFIGNFNIADLNKYLICFRMVVLFIQSYCNIQTG